MLTALAWGLAAHVAGSAVIYRGIPPEVGRVSAMIWNIGSPPAAAPVSVDRSGSTATLRAAMAGTDVVVLFVRADGAYLIDGPFAWPDRDQTREMPGKWSMTLRGTATGAGTNRPEIHWVPVAGSAGDWPRCWWERGERWGCIGAPAGERGVLLAVGGSNATGILSSVIFGDGRQVQLRPAAWGRLLIAVDGGSGPPPGLHVTIARPLAPPADRDRGIRVETAIVAGARATEVTAGAFWLSGDSSPPDAWVEISSSRSGPIFPPLSELLSGPPWVAETAFLPDAHVVDGRVVTGPDQPAASALVSIFRLIEPPRQTAAGTIDPPRRVLVAEATADSEGRFHVEGLGEAEYEILAWHPQFGRASVSVPTTADALTIRLRAPGRVRGRVTVGGVPAAGVDVISVPNPLAFERARDPVDVKGGDARTAADGRFVLALAPGGGGQLRIGGGRHPVVRIPLPRQPVPLLELGDIELGRPIESQSRPGSGHGLRPPRHGTRRPNGASESFRRPGRGPASSI